MPISIPPGHSFKRHYAMLNSSGNSLCSWPWLDQTSRRIILNSPTPRISFRSERLLEVTWGSKLSAYILPLVRSSLPFWDKTSYREAHRHVQFVSHSSTPLVDFVFLFLWKKSCVKNLSVWLTVLVLAWLPPAFPPTNAGWKRKPLQ